MRGERLAFGVLGPLRIERAGAPVSTPRSTVLRGLLGGLALARGESVSTDRLISLVWNDRAERTSPSSVQVGICRLRTWLSAAGGPDDAVSRDGAGYRLSVEPDTVDLSRFVQLVEGVSGQPPGRQRAGLARALRMWRGQILADVPTLNRQDPLVLAAEDLVRRCCLDFADSALATSHPQAAIRPLTALARAHPYDEPVQARLIELLAASDRPAEALTRYEHVRVRLADELGVSPSVEMQRVRLAILRRDNQFAARARPPVCQLPPDTADFVGCGAELEAIRAALACRRERRTALPIVVVSGPGGCGKTTLAVHAAHDLRDSYPGGQIFLGLRGCREGRLEAREALRRLTAVLLGEDPVGERSLDEMAERCRAAVAGRRALVVLDDAADAAQLRPLLPGDPSSAVLVTSRARLPELPGAVYIELTMMPVAVAMQLLGQVAGTERVRREPASARELIRLCGRLPLAVRIVGARLAARPHRPVSWLTHRLADERSRLDELVAGDLSVRAVLSAGYRALDPAASRAFRLLGVLDRRTFTPRLVAALLDCPQEIADELADRLVQARLLEVTATVANGPARYRMHDLVRLFARERCEREEEEAVRRLAVGRVAQANPCVSRAPRTVRSLAPHSSVLPVTVR